MMTIPNHLRKRAKAKTKNRKAFICTYPEGQHVTPNQVTVVNKAHIIPENVDVAQSKIADIESKIAELQSRVELSIRQLYLLTFLFGAILFTGVIARKISPGFIL